MRLAAPAAVRRAIFVIGLALSALHGGAAQAILRSDVLADAQSWVDAGVPYSQGRWGSYCSWDYCYEDPLRGGACYRSDCSGFVSATWGLPAPGNNTWGLCDGTLAHEISFDDLLPGDAVIKCNQHVMLFVGWTGGDSFDAYEEYTCGATAELRNHDASSLSASGYIAIRYDEIEDDPPPNTPPTGSLDAAGCTVSGWAEDPDAPGTALGIHVYVGGPAGEASAVGIDAGSTGFDQGFALELPAVFRDGAPRELYAYTFDASEGFAVMLPGSPVTGTCGRPSPPLPPEEAVKRRVPSLAAWSWTELDVAPLEDATVGELADGPALPDAPIVMRAEGAVEVWVLDGGKRRHVVDEASLAAWKLEADVQVVAPAELDGLDPGRDWPAEPFVFRGSGADVWIVDSAEPIEDPGADPESDGELREDGRDPGFAGGAGGPGAGGLSGGCAVARGPGGDSAAWLVLLGTVLFRRRRFRGRAAA